ncbi:hypothetical protein FACS189475_01130 [Betaproteobacteria bacterium]|nr:hypothetical protein FACS189475_01130 [Betaproteobacteria bacterium]
MTESVKVVIIGGGPAGLGAALALTEAGVGPICVLERETETGGASRHCGHPSFGLLPFKRIMTGPGFANVLRNKTEGIDIRTNWTVTELQPGGVLQVATPEGFKTITAERVILATGARETPRSMRLTSGMRPIGICNTGALQQFVYLQKLKPFKRPVIVGSEVVSFSALWTLMNGKMRAVAMLEQEKKCQAYWPSGILPLLFGAQFHTNTKIKSINGIDRVESVTIQKSNQEERTISCDGVVFSGQFVSENFLVRNSCLARADGIGGPRTDQYFQCSDSAYFAAGNMLHPVELGDRCYLEGRSVAQQVITSLQKKHQSTKSRVDLILKEPLTVISPASLSLDRFLEPVTFLIKTRTSVTGCLVFRQNGKELLRQSINGHPDRFVKINGFELNKVETGPPIEVILEII